MSLLSINRLLVGLTPGYVTLTHTAGLLRPRIANRRSLVCNSGAASTGWNGAVAILAQAAEALSGERFRVTVVLSNHFGRYAGVPFEAALAGEAGGVARGGGPRGNGGGRRPCFRVGAAVPFR